MNSMEAQVQEETERIFPIVEELMGLPSRWSGREDHGILDGGEVLAHCQDYAEWKLANPEEWAAEQKAERRAFAAHQPERERILRDALSARTQSQLERAERELYPWIADCPDDAGRELGIVEALEQVVTRGAAAQEEPGWRGARPDENGASMAISFLLCACFFSVALHVFVLDKQRQV